MKRRNVEFGNNIFHGTVDSVRGKVCSTRCRGNRPISLQLNVYFCAPVRRHKITRNILISVFLVACDTDRSHQKAQAEQQAQPEDPGMENSKSLQMQGLQAFPGQAHMAHLSLIHI